ncbi:undecaprenyl-diphosphate phosphatase [Patulibacter brassicae]|uniref:Undecaprenyl-diphosphatase n=1 Tax=Patulibacter brassicae TaxID=1705717 RepID=A0ABU4VLV8_9ACTN|nr:undecaprenyl-diphosphate phosphatase [Patulibacter brassicae]MDX8152445.1 undecaprenyl-diphosphate phosphatase [Patulibacter brassicae]
MPSGLPDHPLRSLVAAQLAGLVHGPAEALPVSSSAHVRVVTQVVTRGRGVAPGDPELAKATEVAAHAGTLAGLTLGLRVEIRQVLRGAAADPARAARTAGLITLASAPTALAAVAFERRIEQRLGSDETIAIGLVVGGFAMTLADGGLLRLRRVGGRALARDVERGEAAPTGEADPAGAGAARGTGTPDPSGATGTTGGPGTTGAGRRGPAGDGRSWQDATIADALLLGLAQATALWPGVSRSGAVLGAARALGFGRGDAGWISAALAGPAVGGATALKTVRLVQRVAAGTVPRAALLPLGAVAVTSALSGRLAAPLARRTLEGVRLAPFGAYRLLVAGGLLATRPPR